MPNLIAVVVVLTAGTMGATAASLPIAASTASSTRGATSDVVETVPVPARNPAMGVIASPAPLTSTAAPRLRFRGQKWVAPHLQRSEAGFAWSLTPKVTVELNYERSAMAPTMPHDHDDGFLTRLKLSFP